MASIPDDLLVIQAGDPDALTKLLNLPDLAVTGLERVERRHALFLQCRVLTDLATCPTCQHLTDRIHQVDRRPMRDLRWAGYGCYLDIRTRRFWCAHGQRPFTARLKAVASHAQTTRGWRRG